MDERVLALDVGDVRIGIAVSDPSRLIAQPVSVYRRVGYGPDVRHILLLCQSYDTHLVLCGLPRNMDGSEGAQAKKIRAFGAELARAGLTVFYQDERLTTVTAERALLEGGMRRDGRRETVDKVAAAVILQRWLDSGAKPVDTNHRNEDGTMDDNNIIELVDEEGKAVEFEHLMTVEHEGSYYIVLMAAQEDEENEEGEVIILKMEKDDKGEDCYVTIDDDNVLQAVYDKFLAAIEEEDDGLPEDEGEEDDE
jgi:putative Holliday junction resolvase